MTPVGISASLIRVLAADAGSESDAALLARFAGAREEAAFAALFDRHGPMVRSVCRRCCRDPHLAADAEQGVWLVLARKAAAVSRPDRLAAWLFGVALRVGRKAAASARGTRPTTDDRAAPDAAVAVMADELLRVLDEELAALPEAERLPLVLCYLEGRTQDEAARVCGASVRTLRRRLDRGRARLRQRLERRGVAPAAALAGLAVAPVAAARPAALDAALRDGPVPSSLSPLIAEELAMGTTTWWLRAALVGCLGVGTAAAAGVWRADDPPPNPRPSAVAAAEQTDLPKGALARLGSPAFRHPGEVEGLAFAAGGKRLAAVGPEAVSGWAVPGGRVEVSEREREKGYRHLTVVSPDGTLAVELFNRDANAEQGTLYAAKVTDLTTGKALGGFSATYRDPQPGPYSLTGAISPDGKTLAIQYCAEVSLYSLPDGALVQRFDDNGRVFRHVAFTPDGKRVVVGTLDRLHLDVWDVATGNLVTTLTAPGAGTGGLSVSPDGKTVAAAVNRQEREKLPQGGTRSADHPETEIVTWNLETGKLARRIFADKPVRSVRCLSDGTVVGVVDAVDRFARSDLRRWRLADGTLLWSAASDHLFRAFAASPDGAVLASVGWSGIVTLWDADTGKARPRTDGHTRAIYSLAFSPDGKTVRTADETELRSWDAATGRPAGTFTHPEFVGFSAWSADGRVVAAGPNTIDDPRRTVAVFEAASGKKLLSVADPDRKAGFGWCGFDLSADGTRLALPVTTGARVHLQLWDVPAAKMQWDAELPADWPPGRMVLAGDRVLAGWTDMVTLDARTGKQLGRADFFKSNVLPPDPSGNTHLYPSPDGRVLGYVIQNVCVVLVDARTGRLLRRIDTPDETHWPLVFSPDGTRFATSTAWTGTSVHVWRTADGARLGRLHGAPSRVLAMAWSPDGRRLATGGEDGTALVWAAPASR